MDKFSLGYRADIVALVKDEDQPQKCWQSITLLGLRIRDSTHLIDEQSLGESCTVSCGMGEGNSSMRISCFNIHCK